MRARRFNRESNPFEMSSVFIPKGTLEMLRTKSKETGLPVSRLISIAIDNEFDSPSPFNYPCLLPAHAFIEFAYAEEAQLMARYLIKFPSGVGRDLLMLCRRDMGIPDRNTFMLAYRELLEAGIIKEVKPGRRVKFEYPENYLFTKLVNKAKEKPNDPATT